MRRARQVERERSRRPRVCSTRERARRPRACSTDDSSRGADWGRALTLRVRFARSASRADFSRGPSRRWRELRSRVSRAGLGASFAARRSSRVAVPVPVHLVAELEAALVVAEVHVPHPAGGDRGCGAVRRVRAVGVVRLVPAAGEGPLVCGNNDGVVGGQQVVEDEVSFVDRLWALFSPLFKGN